MINWRFLIDLLYVSVLVVKGIGSIVDNTLLKLWRFSSFSLKWWRVVGNLFHSVIYCIDMNWSYQWPLLSWQIGFGLDGHNPVFSKTSKIVTFRAIDLKIFKTPIKLLKRFYAASGIPAFELLNQLFWIVDYSRGWLASRTIGRCLKGPLSFPPLGPPFSKGHYFRNVSSELA